MPSLLWKSLPLRWKEGGSVFWYPDDKNHNHPPKVWLRLVWQYLGKHFTTVEDLQHLEDLPLIPLGLTQTPIPLTPLCHPSRVVVKGLNYDCIDDVVWNVLTKIGLIVMLDCPAFIRQHPAVMGTFIHQPSIQGILRAMVVCGSNIGTEKFIQKVRGVSTQEKQTLRSFLSNVRLGKVDKDVYNLACALPLFETHSKRFVSRNDGLCAASPNSLPIKPLRDLIDISKEDSKTLARSLKVRILKPTELLCEMIFPDMQQGRYSKEQVDKVMPYVLKHFGPAIRTDANFKYNIQALPFIPKQTVRVRASSVFDPRNETLQKLFAHEDIFPVGKLYNDPAVLMMLEELGMKKENSITAKDLFQSAKEVSVLSPLQSVRQKSKAILQYLSSHPQKLQETVNGQKLGVLLRDLLWVSRLRQRTQNFPPSLPWWETAKEEEIHFFKPSELKSHQLVNIIGTVKPVVEVESSNEICSHFGWQTKPAVVDVVEHMKNVVTYYTKEEKPYYMVMVKDIYMFFSGNDCGALNRALDSAGVAQWIWNGDGFSSPRKVLPSEPTIDLTPYILPLPSEMMTFSAMFHHCGMRTESDPVLLLQVLGTIKEKYDQAEDGKSRFSSLEVKRDLTLSVEILNELANGEISSELQGMILFPIYLEDKSYIRLERVEHCMYCEDDDWLIREGDHEGRKRFYVHPTVPNLTAKRLGVETKRRETLRPHVHGIPFGQREKLTNRLKRILTGYPCEKEILKELLQNADDAQATEISFIKDSRNHPDKRVFDNSWKQLQGPALCVYNNKPFTSADMEGIRNLGEGSKGEDPNKTGQYGVGFNAVYHLTDVPSFMSKVEDIGYVLCAFDPHCKYVPGATIEEPGQMFNNIATLRRKFPDVFSCYLEDHFATDNGTMFRFPLRTQEMSRVSRISSSHISLTLLNTMMEDLKKEIFEVLLFVNNVRKITLCEVNEQTGKLANAYSVEATMSKEDEAKRQAFADYIKQIGGKMKEGKNLLPSDIPVAKVTYVLNIADNLGNKGKWLIVQQIGFEKEVSRSVTNAFKKQQLGMLPRGGVACLLERTSRDSGERGNKAFCFLPLPFETDLPVHINGHFALDHEARRNLWRDEAGGYRSDWNNALLEDVVASCYLTLLVEVRAFLQLPIGRDASPCVMRCTESEILQRIGAYERFFPLKQPTEPYWKTLVDSLYQNVNMKELKVLPVVRKRPLDVTHQVLNYTSVVEITWFPPTGHGNNQAFFNNLAEAEPFGRLPQKERDQSQTKARRKFEEILLESGFNLVAFSTALHTSFQRSQVHTCVISPTTVVDFYKSISSQEPLCKIGQIPCDVNSTPFRDVLGVILTLLYCKGMEKFCDQLPGLPLLLTNENCLQLFSSKDPKFFPRFHDILPGCPHVFLHELVYREIFSDESLLKSSVLKPLDAGGFTGNLPHTLRRECYGKGAFVEWRPDQKTPPNQRWISRVWVFLGELTRDILEDSGIDEDSKRLHIKATIGSLTNWSILPANEVKILQKKKSLFWPFSLSVSPPSAQLLVPLCKAASVLDYGSRDATNLNLVEVLRKLGVPELNYAMLSTFSSGTPMHSSSNAVPLARLMVSSMKVPTSLLTALEEKIEMDPQSPGRLESEGCKVVLEYFSRSVSSLKDADRIRLKKLPFYLATHGGFIRLDHHSRACVLPIGVPRKEIDALERELDVVFLESCASLSNLFKFLALEDVSVVDVYCNCILPHFSIFSQDIRQSHLEYIRKGILSNMSTSEEDKEKLQNSLRNTPFIPSVDGSIETASSFYDPYVEVFRMMLSPNNFPPKPLDSVEWLTVLRTIGLVRVVSKDHFKRFARDVAQEATKEPTANTYKKSQALVKHLIQRPNVVAEGLLQAVCNIPFVAIEPARKALRDLCQPFQGQSSFCTFKDTVPSEYAEIVWTRAHLLPRWANPAYHKYELELGCPLGTTLDRYCNEFITQLQIMRKPSVDLVVGHCRAICILLEDKSERENSSSEQRATKIAVMERIYDFLQRNPIKNGRTKELLSKAPCILVEQGRKFILPKQAVLELYEDLEIKPYLYSVPREFGKFHPLFATLGCSKHVTVKHYATVLEKLHDKFKNARMYPNEMSVCFRAVKGLFERLEENKEESKTLVQLYFPGAYPVTHFSDGRVSVTPVTLHKSSNLIFNDEPASILRRLQKFNHPFLLDLKAMGVTCRSAMTSCRELLMKLPTVIRPKMLSSVVSEKLNDSENSARVTSEAATSVKYRLSSPQFLSGIIRLIREVNCQDEDFDEELIGSIETGLRSIEICAISNLRTTLVCDGNPIPESEAKVRCFSEKKTTSSGETWTVYLDAGVATGEIFFVVSLVSNVIVELYGELLGQRAVFISQMLNCPPSCIWALLDSSKIPSDDFGCAEVVGIFPNLGTYIPLDDHHLLKDAFEEFDPDEYVGYELEDPTLHDEEGNATYIYARIVKEVTDQGHPIVAKRYKIDIGDNHQIEVDIADLYKFHSLEAPASGNKLQEFDEISDLLEEAWIMPEDKRWKVIKRQYLHWLPDKNVGNEEFCDEVCKQLESEISRLERDEPRGSLQAMKMNGRFTSWRKRALQYHKQQEKYRERRQFHGITTRRPNPQPGEARRWFRQAVADIVAVENDIASSKPSCEWACFKCHQVYLTSV